MIFRHAKSRATSVTHSSGRNEALAGLSLKTASTMRVTPVPASTGRHFSAFLNLIRSDGADRVVVYRLDRLSRNLRDFVNLSQELRDHNVALTLVTAPARGCRTGSDDAERAGVVRGV